MGDKIKIENLNKNLSNSVQDYMPHIGLGNMEHNLKELFGDVKVI